MNANEDELRANFTIAATVEDLMTLPAIETGVIVNHEDVAKAAIPARADVGRLTIKDRCNYHRKGVYLLNV